MCTCKHCESKQHDWETRCKEIWKISSPLFQFSMKCYQNKSNQVYLWCGTSWFLYRPIWMSWDWHWIKTNVWASGRTSGAKIWFKVMTIIIHTPFRSPTNHNCDHIEPFNLNSVLLTEPSHLFCQRFFMKFNWCPNELNLLQWYHYDMALNMTKSFKFHLIAIVGIGSILILSLNSIAFHIVLHLKLFHFLISIFKCHNIPTSQISSCGPIWRCFRYNNSTSGRVLLLFI